MSENENLPVQTEFILYQSPDGTIRVETRLQDETVWLTQDQMAELFGKAKSTINEHIRNIFDEGELSEDTLMRKFGNSEFTTKPTNYYNLDIIIAVGYRVKSTRGTQFRIWATERLREYITKGFAMDDEKLKAMGGGNYFEELLARIRDIRSSEKVFWRKVLDIYATSIDYDVKSAESVQLFATIQNKMHWAAHGQTAAETVYHRVDATRPNMGMTNWSGLTIRKNEVSIAKNYLDQDELTILNRIVTAYLEFAELQALNRKPMYMKDWIFKLNDFLKLSGREVLSSPGTISHDKALKKALGEYEVWNAKRIEEPSRAEEDFLEAVKRTKQIEQDKKRSDR